VRRAKPSLGRVVVLDGSNESGGIVIPAGTRHVALGPRAATTVRFAFVKNGTSTTSDSHQMVSGAPFSMDCTGDEEFEQFELFLFAAAAVTVDVLWW